MKNKSLLKFVAGLFSVMLLLSACDKFEEDTSPKLVTGMVIKNDAFYTKMNQGIALNVLANDSIPGQASVSFGQPRSGSLQAGNTPGSVFYQPNLNFVGSDTIPYKVCLGQDCAWADAVVFVQSDSTNNPCVIQIQSDTVRATQNQPIIYDILRNDVHCNAKPVITYAPGAGQAYINGNYQLVYTPNPGYIGSDVLRYTLGGNSYGDVMINVNGLPCNVIANPDQVTLVHNLAVDSVTIDVMQNDAYCPTGPPATVNLVSQSSHGTLLVSGSGAATRIIYFTTTPNHNITDSFQYRLCQGNSCSTTTVTVNIQ